MKKLHSKRALRLYIATSTFLNYPHAIVCTTSLIAKIAIMAIIWEGGIP